MQYMWSNHFEKTGADEGYSHVVLTVWSKTEVKGSKTEVKGRNTETGVETVKKGANVTLEFKANSVCGARVRVMPKGPLFLVPRWRWMSGPISIIWATIAWEAGMWNGGSRDQRMVSCPGDEGLAYSTHSRMTFGGMWIMPVRQKSLFHDKQQGAAYHPLIRGPG